MTFRLPLWKIGKWKKNGKFYIFIKSCIYLIPCWKQTLKCTPASLHPCLCAQVVVKHSVGWDVKNVKFTGAKNIFLKLSRVTNFSLIFTGVTKIFWQFLVWPRVASSAIFGAVHYVCNVPIKGTILQNVVRSFLHHHWNVDKLRLLTGIIFICVETARCGY